MNIDALSISLFVVVIMIHSVLRVETDDVLSYFSSISYYILLSSNSFFSFCFETYTQLLGINIFTFILAGLIVFFLGMNYILGPGWLGSTIGIPGTGSFDEVSPSIPGMIDLNKPEFRL
jgi:hypothetical protein